jgi:hypothetical protein
LLHFAVLAHQHENISLPRLGRKRLHFFAVGKTVYGIDNIAVLVQNTANLLIESFLRVTHGISRRTDFTVHRAAESGARVLLTDALGGRLKTRLVPLLLIVRPVAVF